MTQISSSLEELGVAPMDFGALPTPAEMKRVRVQSGNAYPKENSNTDTKIRKIVNALQTRQRIVKVTPAELSVNGLCQEEPMEDYLSSDCISSGDICEINRSDIHYIFNKSTEKSKLDKFKDQSHFDLGTFAHMAFLEPDLFERVHVEPTFSLASHDGVNSLIDFYQKLLLLAVERGVIPSREDIPMFEEIDDMKISDKKTYLSDLKQANPFTMIDEKHKIIIDLIKRNYEQYAGGMLPLLLSGSLNECSFYHTDEEYGLDLHVRPDALLFEENIGVNAVVSFKTTRAETIDKYLYDAAKLKYHVKEAAYQRVVSKVTGRKFDTTIMVMLQTVPPYLPAVLILDDADMELSRHEMELGLDKIRDIERGKKPLGFDALAEEGNMGLIAPRFPGWIGKELDTSI